MNKLLLSFILIIPFVLTTNCNNSQSSENKANLNKKADSLLNIIDEKLSENKPDTVLKNGVRNLESNTVNKTNYDYHSEGKPDTIVIEFDENNRLLIPDMHPGAYAEENPTPDMYKPYSFVKNNDNISFEFSVIGIEGDIRGNELFFNINEDFKIISILCDARAGVFFYEDGSGGMQEEFKGEKYGETKAIQTDKYIYEVPKFEGIEDAVSEETIKKADEKADENELLDYDIKISEVTVKIKYNLKGINYNKQLIFKYHYGD